MLKMSKNYVVAPEWLLKSHPSKIINYFAHGIAYEMGWNCVSYEEFIPSRVARGSCVLSLGAPSFVFSGEKFYDLPPHVKVIYWMDDCQWRNELDRTKIKNMVERADLILSSSKTQFNTFWNNWSYKMRWLPPFATEEFLKNINDGPLVKCLLWGRTGVEMLEHDVPVEEHWYPIRSVLAKEKKDWLFVQPHPGYKVSYKNSIAQQTANMLHSYFCCVTDSACNYGALKYNSKGEVRYSDEYIAEVAGTRYEDCKNQGKVIKKYFEIPATGSLLIADNATPEIRELGFIPEENFVVATPKNVVSVVEDCLRRPSDFYDIRAAGMKLVKDNHTLVNRVKEFRSIFDDFFNC